MVEKLLMEDRILLDLKAKGKESALREMVSGSPCKFSHAKGKTWVNGDRKRYSNSSLQKCGRG